MIWIIVLNVLGWPIIHYLVSKWSFKQDLKIFDRPIWILKPFKWEQKGQSYIRYFAVKKWKNSLPDGAKLMGHQFSKNSIVSRDRAYLNNFLLETRRGEFAHWLTMAFTPIFFIWNPPWASFVMVAYALIANMPCIIAQRYNRHVLQRILSK